MVRYGGGKPELSKAIVRSLLAGMLVWGLAACGSGENKGAAGNSPETEPAAEHEIVIVATNWAFDKEEYVVPKDTPVRITLELEGAHGIKVEGTDINLGPGKLSQVVTLKEGVYPFGCSIICGNGHNDMQAKLVVQ
jgi:cytochrome c oxidase subunit 2